MDYPLPFPNVTYRKQVMPYELHRGSIVAFASREMNGKVRTGIIVMDSRDWMLVAVNLYKEEGRLWYSDPLPDDIFLFEANADETLWGLQYYLDCYCINDEKYQNMHPLIAFIERECIERTSEYYSGAYFFQDMLSKAPDLVDESNWKPLKEYASHCILQNSGLQYDRFRIEYYCFLIGVLMIAMSEPDRYLRTGKIEVFSKNWGHFSWMYGIGLGRVLGSGLYNITAVIYQACQNSRKQYLHLYLPLAENFIDKILSYKYDKREKLQEAIQKAREIEAREKQSTDLDDLYKVLFPKCSLDAFSSSRPAASVAEMQQMIEDKERKISALEDRLSATVNDFNRRYDALLHSFEAAAKASVSFDQIRDGLSNLSRSTAEDVLAKLSITLADNPVFMRELPKLMDFVKNNDKPTEVHNHFARESNCQVFNGNVTR